MCTDVPKTVDVDKVIELQNYFKTSGNRLEARLLQLYNLLQKYDGNILDILTKEDEIQHQLKSWPVIQYWSRNPSHTLKDLFNQMSESEKAKIGPVFKRNPELKFTVEDLDRIQIGSYTFSKKYGITTRPNGL